MVKVRAGWGSIRLEWAAAVGLALEQSCKGAARPEVTLLSQPNSARLQKISAHCKQQQRLSRRPHVARNLCCAQQHNTSYGSMHTWTCIYGVDMVSFATATYLPPTQEVFNESSKTSTFLALA